MFVCCVKYSSVKIIIYSTQFVILYKILKIAHLRGRYATQCSGSVHTKEGGVGVGGPALSSQA
jgi:hypothetical protein